MLTQLKCVLLGDHSVGKTCLLITYTSNQFPIEYVPTINEEFWANLVIDEQPIKIDLYDTAGQDDYDRLRPLVYPGTDVFIILLSVISIDSLENVRLKWYPESKHFCPTTPLILVGTKTDLREDADTLDQLSSKGLHPITFDQGVKLANEIGAVKYMEVSSLNKVGLHELFNEAARVAVHHGPTKKGQGRCSLL